MISPRLFLVGIVAIVLTFATMIGLFFWLGSFREDGTSSPVVTESPARPDPVRPVTKYEPQIDSLRIVGVGSGKITILPNGVIQVEEDGVIKTIEPVMPKVVLPAIPKVEQKPDKLGDVYVLDKGVVSVPPGSIVTYIGIDKIITHSPEKGSTIYWADGRVEHRKRGEGK